MEPPARAGGFFLVMVLDAVGGRGRFDDLGTFAPLMARLLNEDD